MTKLAIFWGFKMETFSSYSISRKAVQKQLFWIRRWYFAGLLIVFFLCIPLGIFLGITENELIRVGLIIGAIIILLSAAIIYYFGITNGRTYIFGDCKITYKNDGTIQCECERESDYRNENGLAHYQKTIVPKKIIIRKDTYIVFGEHRQWIVLPLSVSIEPIKNLLASK